MQANYYARRFDCCGCCGRTGLIIVAGIVMFITFLFLVFECYMLHTLSAVSGVKLAHGFALLFHILILIHCSLLCITIITDNDFLSKIAIISTVVLGIYWIIYFIASISIVNTNSFSQGIHDDLEVYFSKYRKEFPTDAEESRRAIAYVDKLQAALHCCGNEQVPLETDRPASCAGFKMACRPVIVALEYIHRLMMFWVYLDFGATFLVALCGFNYGKSYSGGANNSDRRITQQQFVPTPVYGIQSSNNLKSAISAR